MLIFSMIPMNVQGATFDVIVRVYDGATNRLIDNVTSIPVSYTDNGYVQSDDWIIPELSTLTNSSYGRVEKVTGNWYFPSYQASEGSTVVWSINTGTKAIIYHVTAWQPGTGSGNASNGTGSGNIQVGETGNKNWTTTIVYHSNYPDGTDKTFTQSYAVKAYTTSTNGQIYAYNDSPLNWSAPDGYEAATGTLPDGTKVYPWNTTKDGSGKAVNKLWYFTQGEGTIHLYAQWVPVGSEIVEQVTLTSKDGNETYAEQTYFVGDTATALNNDNEKTGQDFSGWDTDESADTVVYNPGDGFEINQDTTVWAVWTQRAVEDTIVLSYDANGGENTPEGEDSGVVEGSNATFTITDSRPTRDNYNFVGWSENKLAVTPDYVAGEDMTVTTDTILYAVWEQQEVDTIVLTYDANGGTGAPEADDSGVAEGTQHTFTVSNIIPTLDGYTFIGWGDTDNGGVDYIAGNEITTSTDKTIYAQWEENQQANNKISEPGMDKKADGVDSIGTVEIGDSITFTLNSHVGEDIVDFVTYDGTTYSGTYDLVFKDTLSGPATLDESSFVVSVDGTRLSVGQYSLDMSPSDGGTFNLTIDIVDLINSGDFDYSRSGLAEVVVSYTATVDAIAEDGDEIRNDASVNDSIVDTVMGEVEKETSPTPPTPPETGSKSALITSLVGSGLIGASAVIFVVNKKKYSK